MIQELHLASMTVKDVGEWMEVAGLEAIVGSCRRCLPSVQAGNSCYFAFVRAVCGKSVRLFPPRVEWLQSWAMLFRNAGTFSNYLGYVRTGCMIVNADTSVFDHPAVKRAKMTVAKVGGAQPREKQWIRRELVEKMFG